MPDPSAAASAPLRTGLYGAIDLGGTNVRAIVADLDGNIRGDDKRRSRAGEGPEVTIGTLLDSLAHACSDADVAPSTLAGLGIATPGWVDSEKGVVPAAPQLIGWRDVPIVRMLEERLGIPVRLENDANAAALGENTYGAGRGTKHMVYITVSTGIGAGIIAEGRLYGGARGSAGELGHTIVDPDGPPCGCGNRGCLESLSSGTAIARSAAEAATDGRSPALAEVKQREGRISARLVAEAARAGDGTAIRIYEEAGHYLGIALANVVNLLSPEAIVLGGGVMLSKNLFLDTAERTMREMALEEPLKYVRLVAAELGDHAGSLGMIARLGEMAAPR
ncbi:MAG TPA: ROK family protein [Dehalococcoidia bacterium]|nr:ROK family protein [Dehalococcoidia bacterium]